MTGSAFAMDVVVGCVSLMKREEVWRREGSKSHRAGGWRMTGSAFAMDVVVACVSLMNREEVWRREGSKFHRGGGWRIHFVCLF